MTELDISEKSQGNRDHGRQNEQNMNLETLPGVTKTQTNGNAVLSYSQQRSWLLNELNPNAAAASIQRAWRVQSRLDMAALQKSLDAVTARHPILRTVYARENNNLVQKIQPGLKNDARLMDLRNIPEPQQWARIQEIGRKEDDRKFDLGAGPLISILALWLAQDHFVLLVTAHSSLFDRKSFDLLIAELVQDFRVFSGIAPKTREVISNSLTYSDFAAWQRSLEETDGFNQRLVEIKKQLNSNNSLLQLPLDFPRLPVQTFRAERKTIRIGQEVSHALRQLAEEEGVEIGVLLLSIFTTLLYRYSGQDEIVVGVPYHYRRMAGLARMFGALENTIILQADMSDDPPFRNLVKQIDRLWTETELLGDYPYEKLIDDLQPTRDLSTNPLHLVHYAHDPDYLRTIEFDDARVELLWERRDGRCDLSLLTGEDGDEFVVALDYCSDLFRSESAERMLGHFLVLCEAIQKGPETRLSALWMLTDFERNQILNEWNDTEVPYSKANACMHQLFEEQAARSPQTVAVVEPAANGNPRGEITYAELNRRANKLAHLLVAKGAGPEKIVGISITRSIDMIVAMLGILKSGAAYLPLDPYYPNDRLEFMVHDSEAELIVTKSDLLSNLPVGSITSICLDSDAGEIEQMPDGNPESGVGPENLAYIIYTSGSTGNPKGVQILHQTAVNHNLTAGILFKLAPGDRAIQFSTINFDAAVEEIFPPLQHGCTLVLRPAAPPDAEVDVISGSQLMELIENEHLTFLDMATAYWHEWVNEMVLKKTRVPDSVRVLVTGGEKASAEQLVNWQKCGGDRVTWINTYGPTEATVISTWYEVPPGLDWSKNTEIPIGRPIANTKLYILDRHLRLVPVGVPGELFIGGEVLARGYHNRPELTGERFLADPFRNAPGARMYRTGDLVRWLPDGNIEFLGRVDFQVKIRGFRVELGEIESRLESHPEILQSVILAREVGGKSGKKGDLRLIAYVVPRKNEQGIYSVSAASLREWLEASLPHYMIPSAFVFLEALPLTPGGKVDRRALPEPNVTSNEGSKNYLAPRTELESQLVRIWEEFLEVRPIGVRDNFFDLGGHSLMALRLFGRVEKELGANLPLAALLQTPTVEYLAELIDLKYDSLSWSPLVPIQPLGSRPPFFGVHGLDGNVLFWRSLTEYLGTDQPFYGLQASGVDGMQDAVDNFQAMAALYIKEIRKIQPRGPYYLGGFSMGGEIAFEMAQQLLEDDEEVALLVMFDTPNPARPVRLLAEGGNDHNPQNRHLLLRKLEDYLGRIRYHLMLMSGLESRQWPAYIYNDLRNRFTRLYLRSMVPIYRKRKRRLPDWMLLAHMQHKHFVANQYYVPRPYPGKITLFRASESLAANPYDHPLSWLPLATGGIEYHVFDSTHRIVDAEFAEVVGEKLQECLSRAREENEKKIR